jgi:hypothetical protein
MLDSLVAYQINLASRSDRWTECLQNQAARGFDLDDIRRAEACLEGSFGALGCARSHVKWLTRYLTETTSPFCMILEDDFDFRISKAEFAQGLADVRDKVLGWDVLLLAGTVVVSTPTPVPHLNRVFEAQSASGYIVRRAYVPTLLGCFLEAILGLERYRAFDPRRLILDRFSIDQAWKRLQRGDNWFIFTPGVGFQRPSFSDIEGKMVDYTRFSH